MDEKLRDFFQKRWQKYFGGASLPFTYYYTDSPPAEPAPLKKRCLICNLDRVLKGRDFIYGASSGGCTGGQRYSGFSDSLRPDFEYFLSCGIPGRVKGERYKKSPELVVKYMQNNPPFKAPGQFLVFKRWDRISEKDNPQVVVFFAPPDVLSGLFTLANYDWAGKNAVVVPMGSGCSSIISYPMSELGKPGPRCVLGMFDVSARPCVGEQVLSFAVPFERFIAMVENMDESFLITGSWHVVAGRINKKSV